MSTYLARRLKRLVLALIFGIILAVAQDASALQCPTNQSDGWKIASTGSSACANTVYNMGFFDSAAQVENQMLVTCEVGPVGTKWPNPFSSYMVGGWEKTPSSDSYQANAWYCYVGSPCTYAQRAGLIYGNYLITRQCRPSTCATHAGDTTNANGNAATICVGGCIADRVGEWGITLGSNLPATSPVYSRYQVPLEDGITCTASLEPVESVAILDNEGHELKDVDGQRVLDNAAIDEILANMPASGCGSFGASGETWVVCVEPEVSPPYPDNGTPGTPAAENFQISETNVDDFVVYDLFSQGTWQGSSGGYGGAETPGGGNTDSGGGSTDPGCVGAECDDNISGGANCDTPPICSGSPIQCFNAVKLWEIACGQGEGGGGGITDTALTAGERDAAIDAGLAGADALDDEVDIGTWLPTPAASACSLADVNVTLLGSVIPIQLSFLCPLLGMLGAFLLIAASILSFKIVYGGIAT